MLASQFTKPGESIEDAVSRYLADHDGTLAYLYLERKVLTEENTDLALEWIKAHMPRLKLGPFPLPTGWAFKVLDGMLPEKVLDAIKNLMIQKGLTTERRLAEGNPFLR